MLVNKYVRSIYLDMDDVLFDNSTEIFKYHNKPYPYNDPNNYGRYDCHNLAGMTHDEMWGNLPIEYWENLPKLPWADWLVDVAMEFENVFILTYPVNFGPCAEGKARSIKKHWPYLYNDIIMTKAKWAAVEEDGVLIDDSYTNFDSFRVMNKESQFKLFPSKLNPYHYKYEMMSKLDERSFKEYIWGGLTDELLKELYEYLYKPTLSH